MQRNPAAGIQHCCSGAHHVAAVSLGAVAEVSRIGASTEDGVWVVAAIPIPGDLGSVAQVNRIGHGGAGTACGWEGDRECSRLRDVPLCPQAEAAMLTHAWDALGCSAC